MDAHHPDAEGGLDARNGHLSDVLDRRPGRAQRRDLGAPLGHPTAVPAAADFDAVAEFRKRARAAVAEWDWPATF